MENNKRCAFRLGLTQCTEHEENVDGRDSFSQCLILLAIQEDREAAKRERANFLQNIAWLGEGSKYVEAIEILIDHKDEFIAACKRKMMENIRGYPYHQLPHIAISIEIYDKMVKILQVYFGIKDEVLMRFIYEVGHILIEAHDVYVDHGADKIDYLDGIRDQGDEKKQKSDEERSFDFMWEWVVSLLTKKGIAFSKSDWGELKIHLGYPIIATGYSEHNGKLAQYNLIRDERQKAWAKADYMTVLITFADLGYFFGSIDEILEFFVKLILEKKFLSGIVEFHREGGDDVTDIIIIDHEKLIKFLNAENLLMSRVEIPEIFPRPIKEILRRTLAQNLKLRRKIFKHIIDHLYCVKTSPSDLPYKEEVVDVREYKPNGQYYIGCDSKYWDVIAEYAIKLSNADSRGEPNGGIPRLSFPPELVTRPLEAHPH